MLAGMNITPLLKGIAVGLAIAAPVGPIGILCLRRTLTQGRAIGLVSGLGAATADALCGTIAAFGLTAVSRLLLGGQDWLHGLGGLFLCYLGVKTFLAAPTTMRPIDPPDLQENGPALLKQRLGRRRSDKRGLWAAYSSGLALTLTNPMTILSFTTLMAGLEQSDALGQHAPALLLVAGVFGGSALWWLTLSSAASLLRRWMSPALLRWINRASGLLLFTFGVLALSSLV